MSSRGHTQSPPGGIFFPGLDVMPFPTTPSTRGKRAGQELKSGTSKSP